MAYVRAVADGSITSILIRGHLHDLFSHVGFKMDDEQWLDCRWAMGKSDGVQIRAADSVHDTRHYDFTFAGIEDAIAYGKTLIGTKYDLSNIEGLVFDPAIHDPHRLICSRFVQECAVKVGNPLFNPKVPFWEIVPGFYPLALPQGYNELDRFPKDLVL